MTNLVRCLVMSMLLIGGCGGLSRPYPEKERFGLSLPAAAGKTRPDPSALHGVLRVERIHVGNPYDARSFVYRTGEQKYSTDYYYEFIAPPSQLLTGMTVDAIGAGGPFAVVLDPAATADASLRLETTITQLYGDYRDSKSPKAYVSARFMVLSEDSQQTRVLGQWVLEESEPMPSADPAELAAAWGRGYGRLLDRLNHELASIAPAREEKKP